MFVGHLAVGFAAKRAAPEVSLGTLVLSVLFLDLIWPFFLIAGLEDVRIDPSSSAVTPLEFEHFPFTHSLAAAVFWGLLVAGAYYLRRKHARSAGVLFGGVISHWLLDFISHRPDLPLWPGSSVKAGLGLWNSLPGTAVVELSLYAAGVAIYIQATSPHVGKKTWGPWGLVTTLFLIQLWTYGKPPPNEMALVLMGIALWFLVPWAGWVDKRRTAKAFRSDALFRLGVDQV